MNVAEIVKKFVGVCAMAWILKLKYPSIIQWCKNRNRIPEWRWTSILQAAKDNQINLTDETGK